MTMIQYMKRLRRCDSGVAMLEFAFTAPIILSIGLSGVELANLALANLRVSQIALSLADNMSRIGQSSALQLKQVYESDVNDAMLSASLQSDRFQVLQRGRIIVSSLERVTANGPQTIKWQRCKGAKMVNSSYGRQGDTVSAMGPAGRQVTAPAAANSGLMFIEVSYDYLPIVGDWLVPSRTFSYTAAYTVRDQRDFAAGIIPSPPSVPASCSVYSAT